MINRFVTTVEPEFLEILKKDTLDTFIGRCSKRDRSIDVCSLTVDQDGFEVLIVFQWVYPCMILLRVKCFDTIPKFLFDSVILDIL